MARLPWLIRNRSVLSLGICYFVLVFFSPFSIGITSLGEESANLCAFRTFVRFALVWFCLFPLPLSVWKGLRHVIATLHGLFSYLFGVPRKKNLKKINILIYCREILLFYHENVCYTY